MNRYGLTACLTAAAVLSVGVPFRAEAASNYEMRRKVIRLSGIMSLSDETAMVTRGEYAQMLLNASTYKCHQGRVCPDVIECQHLQVRGPSDQFNGCVFRRAF